MKENTTAKYLLVDNSRPLHPVILCEIAGFENAKNKREEIRQNAAQKISIYRIND